MMNNFDSIVNGAKASIWNTLTKKEIEKTIFPFSDDFKKFLDQSKTERLAVKTLKSMFEKEGFSSCYFDEKPEKYLAPGSRFLYVYKKRALFAGIVGSDPEAFAAPRIIGSHIDSPRLDLKPNPLYEDSATNLAMMHTHYYGGIKKFHYLNTPLSMIGAITYKSKNEKTGEIEMKTQDISIGEEPNDPKFVIADLLIHLSQDQMKKNAAEVVAAEDLKIIVGHVPFKEEEENPEKNGKKNGDLKQMIKFNVLNHLIQRGDMKDFSERDLISSDIEFVPAMKTIDIGMDRGLIGGYGQDDRVCAFTAARALIDMQNKTPKNTVICGFFDKEETGSNGNTGAESNLMGNFVETIYKLMKISMKKSEKNENLPEWWSKQFIEEHPLLFFPPNIYRKGTAISSDVCHAYDPVHKSADESQNVCVLSKGVGIIKYCGSRGKSGTSEASSEFFGFIREICEKNDICYQTGEMGKIDLGGGGTIAKFFARLGLDTVDAGVPLLAMHSPCEISSKADVYSTYRLFSAFLSENKQFKE